MQRVEPNSDAPAFSDSPDSQPATEKKAAGKFDLMSKEQRYARAEKLVGKNLKYMRNDAIRSVDWFTRQGPDVVDVAMDECYLLVDGELYTQHIQALKADDDESGSEGIAGLAVGQPTMEEERNCLSVFRAYAKLHGTEFNF
jgi:hypothetical protein